MDQSVTTSFRLPKEVDDELDRIATDAGLSKGKWVREYIMQGLQEATEEKPTQLDELKRCSERLDAIDGRRCEAEQFLHAELASLKALVDRVVIANEGAAKRLTLIEIAMRCTAANTCQKDEECREIRQRLEDLITHITCRGEDY